MKDVASGALVYNNTAVGNITSLALPSGTLVAGEATCGICRPATPPGSAATPRSTTSRSEAGYHYYRQLHRRSIMTL